MNAAQLPSDTCWQCTSYTKESESFVLHFFKTPKSQNFTHSIHALLAFFAFQENCLLKTEYPDCWKKKADKTRYYVVGGASYTTSDLWIWMWEDSNRREKKGRAAKN